VAAVVRWVRAHLAPIQGALTLTWTLLVIPSVLWWRTSIAWVVLMSAWANVAAHAAGWIAALPVDDDDHGQG
jgi:hypothetical protein